MDLRTSILFGCCLCYYVAAVCVDQICTISNCTQHPRRGINEDVFYCSISSREGCAKLKEKFPDQKESSSDDSPPLLKRLTLYPYKHYAALNVTFLIHSGVRNDSPATEAVTMEFWSFDDPVYNDTCKAFNFSPQRVTPAIPAREITYCNITGFFQGTAQKQETLYLLRLTAFPSKSSITYHMLYQGWTFGEIARLQCNDNAVWKPLIAVARRPINGNIHVVVESPPQEFNVQEIEYAVFCGKRTEEEMVPLKSFTRKIFKDDSYQLITEFKGLPPEQCAIKVTPKCMDARKCNESWSHWLDMNFVNHMTPVPPPGIPVVMVAVPVLIVFLLMLGIVSFVLYQRHRKRKPDNSSPQKSIFLTSLSISQKESQAKKITGIIKAFAKMLWQLDFKVTELTADANMEELQGQLESANAIVLLCIPGNDMVARCELLHMLEQSEELRKKSMLGCLHTSTLAEQGCQHCLDFRTMEEGSREEARDGVQEGLLSPAFTQLTAALGNCCKSVVAMDEDKFHDFYSTILSKVESSSQPKTGYAHGPVWEELKRTVNEQPDTSDSSSYSSSGDESQDDDEDSKSESDKSSSSGTEDSSLDDQCGPQHNTPENNHRAAENSSFLVNHHSSRAHDSMCAQNGNINPETRSTPHHGRICYPAGGQNSRFPYHQQPDSHAFHPVCGSREPNGLTSQCLGHCTNGMAAHPCYPMRMHQNHINYGHSNHHFGQSNGHCEPEMHVCFACQGYQVARGGNNGSCPYQHAHHQNAAVCVHQGGSSGHYHQTNGMHGHHQANMRPTWPGVFQNYRPH